jgi:hypothetical protein
LFERGELMRRILGLVALLALVMSAFVSPAHAQSASLTVSPSTISQDSSAELTLTGFAPKEIISFWLTLPDYSVEAAGDLVADADGAVTGFLYLSVAEAVGTYSLSARGNSSGQLATARLELRAAAGAPASPNIVLDVEQSSQPQGECFDFTGVGYEGGETIAVWLRMPDGSVSSDGLEGEFSAESDGSFGYFICFGRLAAEGSYAFTGYGKDSGLTGIAEFSLERGDYLGAPAGDAELSVEPKTARQLETVSIVGGGFEAGELISLWITLPNGVVQSLFSGTTVDGTFQEDIVLPPLPVGTHYISAYGDTSGQRAVATLELLPGDGN